MLAVIGSSQCSARAYEAAREVGREIARRGAVLICGGMSGVMEAACRGAREERGFSIGILPGASKLEANEFVDCKIVTGMGQARNAIIAHTADALIAIAGAYGTLSEIAFGLNFGKPVVGLLSEHKVAGMHHAGTAQEAVELALQLIGSSS